MATYGITHSYPHCWRHKTPVIYRAAVADCAGRGICSVSQGTCACFPAWYSSDGYNNMGRRGDCGVYDLASFGSLSQ
jgi:hypothetical protein